MMQKRIVGRERYRTSGCKKNAFVVELKLECGHTVYRKASQEPKKVAMCPFCLPKKEK